MSLKQEVAKINSDCEKIKAATEEIKEMSEKEGKGMSDQREQLIKEIRRALAEKIKQNAGHPERFITMSEFIADFILARERRMLEPIRKVYEKNKDLFNTPEGERSQFWQAIKTTVEGVSPDLLNQGAEE